MLEKLDKYNALWLSMPAYHHLTTKYMLYEEVSQSNGKEMNQMSPNLLGVVTQSLRGRSPTQHPILHPALECRRALLEFIMYAWYQSHDVATFSYMEHPLGCFHTFKDVLLLGPDGKKTNTKPNTLKMELAKKRQVDKEVNAETWMPSKKWREMKASQDNISDEIDLSKKFDPDSNCLKVNLMSHWVKQIRQYGGLQPDPAERQEQAHETNLKDSSNTSNHNLDYLPQVIIFQRRILLVEFTELHLQAVAQRRENSAAAGKVLPSGANLAPPQSSKSYVKPRFMGPQNCHDGKHPDAMMKDFRPLLDNTKDAMCCVVIYCGTGEWIRHSSRNKPYISDEQLHSMELCIYHGIKVRVEGLEGEHTSQMCWCTGCQSWRRGDRWHDRVGV